MADPDLNTLVDYRYRQHVKAERGHNGMVTVSGVRTTSGTIACESVVNCAGTAGRA